MHICIYIYIYISFSKLNKVAPSPVDKQRREQKKALQLI